MSHDFILTTIRQSYDIMKALSYSILQSWWLEISNVIQFMWPILIKVSNKLKIHVKDITLSCMLQTSSYVSPSKQNTTSSSSGSTTNTTTHNTTNTLKSKCDLSATEYNLLIGFLAMSGGWFPSQALVPGTVVSHLGVGSSLSEKYVIVGYSAITLFGETVVLYPLGNSFDSLLDTDASSGERRQGGSGSNDSSNMGDSNNNTSYDLITNHTTMIEIVFSTFLQGEQTRNVISPSLTYLFQHSSHNPKLLELLSILIDSDSCDLRPPLVKEFEIYPTMGISTEQSLVLESPHPYRDNTDETYAIAIPGATELIISFDPQSKTEATYDYLRFFKDTSQTSYWGQEKYSGNVWPGVGGVEPLRIGAGSCLLHFHTDGSNK